MTVAATSVAEKSSIRAVDYEFCGVHSCISCLAPPDATTLAACQVASAV